MKELLVGFLDLVTTEEPWRLLVLILLASIYSRLGYILEQLKLAKLPKEPTE